MRHTTVADVMSTNVISANPQDHLHHRTDERTTDARAIPMY